MWFMEHQHASLTICTEVHMTVLWMHPAEMVMLWVWRKWKHVPSSHIFFLLSPYIFQHAVNDQMPHYNFALLVRGYLFAHDYHEAIAVIVSSLLCITHWCIESIKLCKLKFNPPWCCLSSPIHHYNMANRMPQTQCCNQHSNVEY